MLHKFIGNSLLSCILAKLDRALICILGVSQTHSANNANHKVDKSPFACYIHFHKVGIPIQMVEGVFKHTNGWFFKFTSSYIR